MNLKSKIDLRLYQKEGLELIKNKKNFGLFWQQRLGKTIVAIKAVEDYDKVIFSVPNNVAIYWYQEIKNNLDLDFDCKIIDSNKKNREKIYQEFNEKEKMWIIVSYDILSRDRLENPDLLNDFDYLVLDEAHFLRNRKTVRSKNILKVRAKAKYALALSGTPAVNGSLDILKIFQFLFPQENYGSRYYYKKKFFHSEKNSKNQKIWVLNEDKKTEWESFINGFCDIKKTHDYLKWLPKTIEKTISLEMTGQQLKHYKKMLIESRRLIEDRNTEKYEKNKLVQIKRLQQICLDPKLLDLNSNSVKIDWLKEYLNNTLEDESEYIIVFTNFTSLYNKNDLSIKKYSYDFLTGQQNSVQKQDIIKRFQNKEIRVLYANMKVASLGLTIDTATTTIFLDKSWSPVDNEQASFRMVDTVERENLEPKLLINVICNNSIDDRINQVLSNKKSNSSFVYEMEEYIKNE